MPLSLGFTLVPLKSPFQFWTLKISLIFFSGSVFPFQKRTATISVSENNTEWYAGTPVWYAGTPVIIRISRPVHNIIPDVEVDLLWKCYTAIRNTYYNDYFSVITLGLRNRLSNFELLKFLWFSSREVFFLSKRDRRPFPSVKTTLNNMPVHKFISVFVDRYMISYQMSK